MKFAKILILLCAFGVSAHAQMFNGPDLRVRGPVKIDNVSTPAQADASAWLDIGEDSTNRAAILLHRSDTSNTYCPIATRKPGLIIFRYSSTDTTSYMWTGKRWKPL